MSKQQKRIKHKVTILIYETSKDPDTHKPQFEFEGEVMSARMVDIITHNMRKALRMHKHKISEEQRKDVKSDD